MAKKEMLKCETCGSYIDIETGETFPPSGGNANKIIDMQKTNRMNAELIEQANTKIDILKEKLEKTGNGQEPKKSTVDEIL